MSDDRPTHVRVLISEAHFTRGRLYPVYGWDNWGPRVINDAGYTRPLDEHEWLIDDEAKSADPPVPTKPRRKVVQIAGTVRGVIALCSDGSLWGAADGLWHRLPEIPQDDAP